MYFGVSNDELREHALILTKKLGYRFSTGDWMLYAKENKLPDQFSRWRNTHFGGILGLGKWAALECGFDKFIDEDPRIVKNYKKYTSEGYNCRIEKGGLVYIKKCEICGFDFAYNTGKFTIHLMKEHNLNLRDYIIQYELSGVTPKCQCGFCEEDAPFFRGEFLDRIGKHQKYDWYSTKSYEEFLRVSNHYHAVQFWFLNHQIM
jgi:hypothetical protein